MKNLTLSLDDCDDDFSLIGISTSLKGYKLCWEINNLLNFNLIRYDDIELIKKDMSIHFAVYKYEIEEDFTSFYLISNNNKNINLLPERKEADFLLMIKEPISNDEINSYIKKLRNINNIQIAFNIIPETLKSRNNLIIE